MSSTERYNSTEGYRDTAENMEEARDRLVEALDDLQGYVSTLPSHIRERAKAYWTAHIAMAVDDDHGYLGGSMCTVQSTINELYEFIDDEECCDE